MEGAAPGAVFAAVNDVAPTALGAFAVFTFEPALTVELEAITALIEPMEFGWRWVTSHRHTSSLLPAAILGTLSLESPFLGLPRRARHVVSRLALILAEGSHLVLVLSTSGCLQVCVGNWGWGEAHEFTQGLWEGPQSIFHAGQNAVVAFQLGRVATLKGASSTKSGALWAGEGGSIDVMVIWDSAVHWLTSHLLVPFALCTCHCDAWSYLALDQLIIPLYLQHITCPTAHSALGTMVAVTAGTVERGILHSQFWTVRGFTGKMYTALLSRAVGLSSLAAAQGDGVKVVEGAEGHPRDGDQGRCEAHTYCLAVVEGLAEVMDHRDNQGIVPAAQDMEA